MILPLFCLQVYHQLQDIPFIHFYKEQFEKKICYFL
jgi:hypothetical protein